MTSESNNTTAVPTITTSHFTNESSDTDFTDVTGGTSIKTDLSIHHGAASINVTEEHGALANRRLEVDIRQQYELASKTVPNVTEEMEKWFEKADR